MHTAPTPDSAWYASGLRWIASGIASFADAIDREPEPPRPVDDYCPAREFLLRGENGARNNAARGLDDAGEEVLAKLRARGLGGASEDVLAKLRARGRRWS